MQNQLMNESVSQLQKRVSSLPIMQQPMFMYVYVSLLICIIWSILTGESTARAEQFVVQEGKKSYNNIIRHFLDFKTDP